MEEEIPQLGPPHIPISIAFILTLEKEDLTTETRAELLAWWREKIEDKTEEETCLEIQSFRCKKPLKFHKKHGGAEFAKVTFKVGSLMGEEILVKVLTAMGGTRKVGTPPKGSMEREASRLLDLYKKRNQKK